MKIKLLRFPNVLAVLILLGLIVYTVLVTPRRFGRCLAAPMKFYFEKNGQGQQARLPAALPGNHVELLVNGNEALPAALELIAGARHTIRWQVMMFHPDEAGRTLAAALADAARRGVKVQLSFNIGQTVSGTIADGLPREQKQRQNRQMQAMLADLRSAGVEVRDNPAGVDFPLEGVDQEAREILQNIQRHVCISANHYDHRKLLVVDGARALVGGMNVGNGYFYRLAPDVRLDMAAEARQRQKQGLPEPWEKWQDAVFIVDGPAAGQLADEFDWKWAVLGGQRLPSEPAEALPAVVPVQVLRQYPGLPQVSTRFFELAGGATQEIYVASPFVSYEPALEALAQASRRGVRVIFVVPVARQEVPLSRSLFLESAQPLLDAGVSLFFNDLRMAHTKLMVVDGRQVLLGSINLNHRSFRHDLEIAAVVEDEDLARQVVERVFLPYLDISRPIERLPDPPWNPLNWLLRPFS